MQEFQSKSYEVLRPLLLTRRYFNTSEKLYYSIINKCSFEYIYTECSDDDDDDIMPLIQCKSTPHT